jgi:hypothetical protein
MKKPRRQLELTAGQNPNADEARIQTRDFDCQASLAERQEAKPDDLHKMSARNCEALWNLWQTEDSALSL